MENRKKKAAASLARDLALKMIEHRALGPDNLAESLALLNLSIQNLFKEIQDDGGPLIMRLARDFTLKDLERKRISSAQDAAAQMGEYARMLFDLAQKFPPEDLEHKFQIAKDLSLKLLETGRLSASQLPALLEKLLHSL